MVFIYFACKCSFDNDWFFFNYSLLPTPSQVVWDREDEAREQKLRQRPVSALVKAVVTAPPYGQRKGWIPRSEEVSDKIISKISKKNVGTSGFPLISYRKS